MKYPLACILIFSACYPAARGGITFPQGGGVLDVREYGAKADDGAHVMLPLARAAPAGGCEVGDGVGSEVRQEKVPGSQLPHHPAGTPAARVVRRPRVVLAVARLAKETGGAKWNQGSLSRI